MTPRPGEANAPEADGEEPEDDGIALEEALADLDGEEEPQVAEADANGNVPIDEAHFPAYWMRDLANGADHDRDGFLSPEECATVTEIDLTWEPESYEGIQYFTALKALTISGNTDLQSLDLRSNTKLERLDISRVPNLLTLDLSQNTELTYLQCTETGLDSLDLTHNTKLSYLRIPSNKLGSLDLSYCPDLSELYASCCQLSSLVLGDSPVLKVPGPTPCVQARRRVSLRAERASARRSW